MGTSSGRVLTVPLIPPAGVWESVLTIPPWVMPVSFWIGNGRDHEQGAINGIDFNIFGDLILYRKILSVDRERYPELVGIEDIWLEFSPGEGM